MSKSVGKNRFYLFWAMVLIALTVLVFAKIAYDQRSTGLENFHAQPFLTTKLKIKSAAAVSAGISPATIKKIYNLPSGNVGSGTIAIVDAYDNPNTEGDLAIFSKQFNLPSCTSQNGCFTKAKMKTKLSGNTGWGVEENLDVQWVHAIAPNAKILLVEAISSSGPNLMAAVSYAKSQPNVVAVSMSWGGAEYSGEAKDDSYFSTNSNIQFFAAAGDDGHATSWPAASTRVVAVGGTTLNLDGSSKLMSETAWSGSGGGISKYIAEPIWQKNYGISNSSGKRAIPDVSYNADPNSGYPVYDSYGHAKTNSWLIVGGTSASTPQWAAIQALGKSTATTKLYGDAKSKNASQYFRDIMSGSNGSCKLICAAGTGYDFITGLGSPLTQKY
jgi:subtilase family serine protease